MLLAKAMAGMMVPWSELSVIHVQSLVDKAFGENLYVVQQDDVWCGLVHSSIHLSPLINPDSSFWSPLGFISSQQLVKQIQNCSSCCHQVVHPRQQRKFCKWWNDSLTKHFSLCWPFYYTFWRSTNSTIPLAWIWGWWRHWGSKEMGKALSISLTSTNTAAVYCRDTSKTPSLCTRSCMGTLPTSMMSLTLQHSTNLSCHQVC